MRDVENRKKWQREYYKKNPKPHLARAKEWRKKNGRAETRSMKTWEGYIPIETKCQICNKDIFFNRRNVRTAIHFDHRSGKEPIKGSPQVFLRNANRTPKREKIWKECNFGMLCQRCNLSLPTDNRIQFLLNALKYCGLEIK